MRLIISFLFLFLCVSCFKDSSQIRKSSKNDLKGFKEFLGLEKSKADDLLIMSFDQFLMDNFPNEKNQNQRTKRFLEFLKTPDSLGFKNINFKSSLNKESITQLSKSELRPEIWLLQSEYNSYHQKYNVEDLYLNMKADEKVVELGELVLPQNIPIQPDNATAISDEALKYLPKQKVMDNQFRVNYKGDYFYGLALFSPNDANIQEYIQAIIKVGDLSPSITASGFLKRFDNFEEPFIKRVLILEYFRIPINQN